MTKVPRWFIKIGLLYLALGGGLGALFMVFKGLRISVPWYAFIPAHAHLMFVGFITHLVMGVAYWMFPRPKVSRYSDRRAWLNLGLLDTGLLMRVVFEPWQTLGGGKLVGWFVALSGTLQFLGLLTFVVNIWDRIYFPPVAGKK